MRVENNDLFLFGNCLLTDIWMFGTWLSGNEYFKIYVIYLNKELSNHK